MKLSSFLCLSFSFLFYAFVVVTNTPKKQSVLNLLAVYPNAVPTPGTGTKMYQLFLQR